MIPESDTTAVPEGVEQLLPDFIKESRIKEFKSLTDVPAGIKDEEIKVRGVSYIRTKDGLNWTIKPQTPKKQFTGQVNQNLMQPLNLQIPNTGFGNNMSGGMNNSSLGVSSIFDASNPSNFSDPGTWGQIGDSGISSTSNMWRPFTTEGGNLYRGIQGGEHLTNEDISLLSANVNAGYDAEGNYQSSITPNKYTGMNRFADKFMKPFANQVAVGAQDYGQGVAGNFNTMFGEGQGGIMDRLGNLDAKTMGQTAELVNIGAGIANTWTGRTQSQLVGDAEAALEASNYKRNFDQGWYSQDQTRLAERGGNMGECKECDKMKTKKYQTPGNVDANVLTDKILSNQKEIDYCKNNICDYERWLNAYTLKDTEQIKFMYESYLTKAIDKTKASGLSTEIMPGHETNSSV